MGNREMGKWETGGMRKWGKGKRGKVGNGEMGKGAAAAAVKNIFNYGFISVHFPPRADGKGWPWIP
jgi:hypothetical protein